MNSILLKIKILILLFLASMHGISQEIFWIDNANNRIGKIEDTENAAIVYLTPNGLFSKIITMDISFNTKKIYFAAERDAKVKIYRCDIDGNNLQEVNGIYKPKYLIVDDKNSFLYWIESQDYRIYRSGFDGNNITALTNPYNQAQALAYDKKNEKIYFSIGGTNKTYKMNANGSDIREIFAIHEPIDMFVDTKNNKLFWANAKDQRIYNSDLNGTNIRILTPSFSELSGLDFNPTNEKVYFSDTQSKKIYKMNADGSNIQVYKTNLAFRNIVLEKQKIIKNTPPEFTSTPVATATQGKYYSYFLKVEDPDNNTLTFDLVKHPEWLKLSQNKVITAETFAGSGVAGLKNGSKTSAEFNNPKGIAVDKDQNIYIADHINHVIRKITPEGEVSIFAGTGSAGLTNGKANEARFKFPTGIAIDKDGNFFVTDYLNHVIRKIDTNGEVSTYAGSGFRGSKNGDLQTASFYNPIDLAIDDDGNIYVADEGNHQIRKISPTGTVSLLAGHISGGFKDGKGSSARFKNPSGIAVGNDNNIYVADYENHVIRKITPLGLTTTYAGTGKRGNRDGNLLEAEFKNPIQLCFDDAGNLFVADRYNHAVRIIADGKVSTYIGTKKSGYKDGGTDVAQFSLPEGIAVDDLANIYVSDSQNNRIRKIKKPYAKLTGTPQQSDIGTAEVKVKVSDGFAVANQNYQLNVYGLAPTISAKDMIFSNVEQNSMTLSWTSGNGSARILLAKEDSSVDFVPTDGILPSGINADFTLAANCGNGNKILYNGNGNTITITGLSSQKIYHFAVYEYNGFDQFIKYKPEPLAANYSTLQITTQNIAGSPFFVDAENSAAVSIPFSTIGVFDEDVVFTAFLSDKNGNFDREIEIGASKGKDAKSISGTLPAGLLNGTAYRIRIKSSSPEIISKPSNEIQIVSQLLASLQSEERNITNKSQFEIIIEFSEEITGFSVKDLYIKNAYINNFTEIVKNKKWSVEIVPTGGKIEFNIPEEITSNLAGVKNNASDMFEINFDNTPPEVKITSDEKEVTNKTSFDIKIEFDEVVYDFTPSDIHVENAEISNRRIIEANKIWEFTLAPNAKNVKIFVPENVAKDAAQNGNKKSQDFEIIFDNVRPKLTLSTTEPSTTNKKIIPVTIEFDEEVFDFTASMISLKNASIQNFVSETENKKWTFDLVLEGKEVKVGVKEKLVGDIAGNLNEASNELVIHYDAEKPTVSISSTEPNPTNHREFELIVEFSEEVFGFDKTKIRTKNAEITDYSYLIPNKKWRMSVTALSKDLAFWMNDDAVRDKSQNGNLASDTFRIVYDNMKPRVNLKTEVISPTKSSSIDIIVEFSKKIDGFSTDDFMLVNAEIKSLDEIEESLKYKLTIKPTGENIVVSVVSDAVSDAAGNTNFGSEPMYLVYDNLGPTLLISSNESNRTNREVISVYFEFSEEVTNFDFSQLEITNGTLTNIHELVEAKKWSADVLIGGEQLIIKVPANSVVDKAGNSNPTGGNFTIIYDTEKPVAVITSEENNPTSNKEFDIYIEFNEMVKSFSLSDLETINCQAFNSIEIIQGKKWKISIKTLAPEMTIKLLANKVTDLAGNTNKASEKFEILYDSGSPEVALEFEGTGSSGEVFAIRIEFTEEVSDFDINDVSIENGVGVNLIQKSEEIYIFEFTPEKNKTVTIQIKQGVVTDIAGNQNEASRPIEVSFGNDIIAPEVKITSYAEGTVSTNFSIDIHFSEEVINFTQDDIIVENGKVTDLYMVNTTTYTAYIDPYLDGEVSVNIYSGSVYDYSYNGNVAAKEFSIMYGNTSPTGMTLSNSNVTENQEPGTIVGEFFTSDPTENDEFTYSLIHGNGINDVDNDKFDIDGNKLVTKEIIDYEKNYECKINVQTKDKLGGTFVRSFILKVIDLNEAPYVNNPLIDHKIKLSDRFDYKVSLNTFKDHDYGDFLSYEAKLSNGFSLPDWIRFDNSNLIFYGDPEQYDTLEISITATDKRGLSVSDSFTLIIYDPTGISVPDSETQCLKLFPNPSKGILNVSLKNIDYDSEIEIIDLTGKSIMRFQPSSSISRLDLGGNPPGIYLLQLKTKKGKTTRKIVLK